MYQSPKIENSLLLYNKKDTIAYMNNEFKEHLLKYLSEQEIESLLTSIDAPRKQGLLLNTKKCSEELLLSYFPSLEKHPIIKNGYIYDPLVFQPGKHFLFNAGAYYLQDLSAMLVGHFVNPLDNEIIADLCAAPGGKTTQIALKNTNTVVIANDLSGLRAKNLAQNIERFGLDNVVVTNEDALRLLSKSPYYFDKIVLDAPCSGSGMFRKNEEMIKDWSLNKVLKFAETQKELILAAYNKLKEGGLLIYSTCSFSYEEDEEVIDYLLNHSNAQVEPIPLHPSYSESPTIKGAIHLFPSKFEGDGHFICLIRKPGTLVTPKLEKASLQSFGDFLLPVFIENKGPYYFAFKYKLRLPFNIVRLGIFLGEKNNKIVDYNHHLSLYLSPALSVGLDMMQKEKYLRGETFELKTSQTGFHPVSYQGINLGFVKIVNGVAKNHYPKALRVR